MSSSSGIVERMFGAMSIVASVLAISVLIPAEASAAEQQDTLLARTFHAWWGLVSECSIIFAMMCVYFLGARCGRFVQDHYRVFQELFQEEKLKLRQAQACANDKVCCPDDDDDVSTFAGSSDLSGSSSSDDEAENASARSRAAHPQKRSVSLQERLGCVVPRDDMIRIRPAKGMPPARHLHARVVHLEGDSLNGRPLSMPTGRWSGLHRDERDWGSLRKANSASPKQAPSLSPREVEEDTVSSFVFSRPAPGLSLFEETGCEDQWHKELYSSPIASKKGSLTGSLHGISLSGGGFRPGSALGGLRPGGSLNSHRH